MAIPTRTKTIKQALPGLGRGQTWGVRGTGQSIWETSKTPKHKLGDRLGLGVRTFYYSLASEDLTAGNLASFKPDSDAEDTVTVAHPIGTTALTITAATAFVKDQYAEGLLAVVDGAVCDGDQYIIKGNDVIGGTATGEVRIYDPGLVTAWTTVVNVMLYTSIFYNIQESNSGQKESPAGTSLIDVDQSVAPYFWLQTYGPAAVLHDVDLGNNAQERAVGISDAQDGAVEYVDADGEATVGYALLSGADNEDAHFHMIFLTCVR